MELFCIKTNYRDVNVGNQLEFYNDLNYNL